MDLRTSLTNAGQKTIYNTKSCCWQGGETANRWHEAKGRDGVSPARVPGCWKFLLEFKKLRLKGKALAT